jgi:hypothetical protein
MNPEQIKPYITYKELSPEAKMVAIRKNTYSVLQGMVDWDTPVVAVNTMLSPEFTRDCLENGFYKLNPETLKVMT